MAQRQQQRQPAARRAAADKRGQGVELRQQFAQILGPDLVLRIAAVERDGGGAAIAPVVDQHPIAGLGDLIGQRLDPGEGAPTAGLHRHPRAATAEHLIIDVDAADRYDRHSSPPWPNIRNSAILADIGLFGRGIAMQVGVFYFPTDYGIDPGELATGARNARLCVPLRARAHAHPDQPEAARFRRRRIAEEVFAHPRSVRRAVLCRSGDQEAAARHRHLPDPGARPDRHREIASPASTNCQAGGSSSASAAAGMSRRWKITAPDTTPASS